MYTPIYRPMTSTGIMEILRSHLRQADPEYAKEENAFQEAVQSLKSVLKPDTSPLLDAWLSAEEDRLAACLRYLFWPGLHQNEACFQDPEQKNFLEQDFEDICQEQLLNSLPEAARAHTASRDFDQALPREHRPSADAVAEYYCYLETVGYKLAHYWGFRYGDALLLLPKVLPGYVPDLELISTYRRMVHEYLEFDPEA